MKKITLFLSLLGFAMPAFLNAQVYATKYVETAGTLVTLLTWQERSSITDLTLTGNINYLDFQAIQSMMNLKNIDLNAVHTDGDSIPRNAFPNTVHSVILPSTLKTIGTFAFAGTQIDTITLPNSVRIIRSFGFVSSPNLKKINLSSSLAEIGSYAFASCNLLDSIELPTSLKKIGYFAFVSCNGLTSIDIPDSVRSLGFYAFASCSNMKHVNISASLDSIERGTFVSCSSLKEATIPSSVRSLGYYSFAGCSNLDSVTFLASAGCALNKQVFGGCPSLRKVVFQSPSVTTLGYAVFAGNSNITEVQLPNSLQSIGASCFASCSQLQSPLLPHSLKVIGEQAFMGCHAITTFQIPNSVDSIGDRAFFDCEELNSVFIPSSVNSLGLDAFSQNIKLQQVKVTRMIPLVLAGTTFSAFPGVPRTLWVPHGSLDAYQQAEYWRDFDFIKEYDPGLSVSADTLFLADTAGIAQFELFATSYWQVDSCPSWIVCTPVEGFDSTLVKFTFDANPGYFTRKGEIRLSGDNVDTVTITILQLPAPKLSLSTDTVSVDGVTATEASFSIHSNTGWTVTCNEDWLTVEPVAGYGDMLDTIKISENPTDSFRISQIKIAANGVDTQSVWLIQAPHPWLLVSEDTIRLESDQFSDTYLDIASNASWTVSSNAEWLTLQPMSGRGDQQISMTAEFNTTFELRNADITILTKDFVPAVIHVIQEGAILSGLTILNINKVMLYPNPVTDVLHVDGCQDKELQLFNTDGKLLLTKWIGSDHAIVDISSLPAGMYIVIINNEHFKIMK